MKPSAGALMLGLAAVRTGRVPPRLMAECLGAVLGQPVPDEQVALQERLRERLPALSGSLGLLVAQCAFVPVHCAECGASLRARAAQVEPSQTCPVCEAPLVVPHNAAALWPAAQLAAEPRPAYRATRRADRLGHFELVRLIGSGGFGRVYEARNLRAGRTVALKVLEFRPLETRRQAFTRLLHEQPAASYLQHPHVVPVWSVGLSGGVPYVEMDLMPRGSLADLVGQRGPLPWREACGYMLEVLSALSASHATGIIHRDIKPSNILLDGGGRARLADFGLSKLIGDTTSSTTSGVRVGSPHFMAPEQWTGAAVGPWTDIYAVGLVAYYLLAGRPAFEGDSALSLMYSHLHMPPPDPRAAAPDLPVLVALAIQKAAAKQPEGRFQSAEQFASDLREVLG